MILFRWALYGLATWLLLIGLWDHAWRLIVASLTVAGIYPLISEQVEEVPVCTGCQRHFVKPGCPVHDTGEWRDAA